MERLTRIALDHPKKLLTLVLALTLVFALGLLQLRTEFGFRVLLGNDHPSIQRLEGFIKRFGGGLPIQIAWECGPSQPCENVFDERSLQMSNKIARSLSSVEGVRSIYGPANAPIFVPTANGFAVRRLVENGETVPDIQPLVARALEDPMWLRNLVSEDTRVGVLIVQPADIRNETDVRVVEAIQQAIAPFQVEGFEFHLVGNAISAVLTGRELAKSMASVIPLTVVVIAAVLVALFRSWQFTLSALCTMGVALLWTFGAHGWLGWPRDAILESLAPLVLVVGVCDSIHVLARHSGITSRFFLSHGRYQAALADASASVSRPCLVTTLTTSAALLSFSTSALETFVRFSFISAFGVLVCLFLTFTMLPALVSLLPPPQAASASATRHWSSALSAIIRTSQRRSRLILVASLLLTIVCGVGWARRLEVDTYWYELIGEQSPSVRSIRFLENRLRPSASLEVQVSLDNDHRLEDPAALDLLSEFSRYLEDVDGLGKSTSILDSIGTLNRLLHNDDPRFERPAQSIGANAEILELISFEDPDLLASWMTLDRSSMRISVEALEQSNVDRQRVLDAVRTYVAEEMPPDWEVTMTGGLPINFDWVRDVQSTQMRSFPVAFALVAIMAIVFLRSFWLGMLAMVPTLIPVVVTLGIMGWMGVSLDVGRAMIAAILIGIAVDDSIHLISQYREEIAKGKQPSVAIRGAVMETGRAVATTSVAVSLGFLMLMASAWQTLSSFGFFVSLAIMGALVATLFVVPALIFEFARPSPGSKV